MNGAWIFLIFVVAAVSVLLLLLHKTPLGGLVHQHIADPPRRRLFVSAVSFCITFAGVRALTWSIHHEVGPFHDIHMGGRHIHHLVWGILLLLIVGYGWLAEIGTGTASSSMFLSRAMALLYGAGAALTLDEFALWLNLRDVYWAREGRSSVDVALLFGSLLLIGWWGAPFWRGITHGLRLPRRSLRKASRG